MKTVKLGLCFAIALALIIGLCMPVQVQAGDLNGNWYEGSVQGSSKIAIINSDGEIDKVKIPGRFYFKVCTPDPADDPDNACGGKDYDVVVAIADLNDDGSFTADEAFSTFTLFTCGNATDGELSFVADIALDDLAPADEADNVAIDVDVLGSVKSNGNLRANKGSNGGVNVEVDDADLPLDVDGVTRNTKIKANVVSNLSKLPFDPDSAEFIAIFGSTLCASEEPPIADAGENQVVNTGEVVNLDGSGSTAGGGGGPLTYSWNLTVPMGSAATLSDAAAVNPTFTADVDGDYTATLVVNDGALVSLPVTVTVTATTP